MNVGIWVACFVLFLLLLFIFVSGSAGVHSILNHLGIEKFKVTETSTTEYEIDDGDDVDDDVQPMSASPLSNAPPLSSVSRAVRSSFDKVNARVVDNDAPQVMSVGKKTHPHYDSVLKRAISKPDEYSHYQ